MIMADILKFFLLIVGLLTVYVSYWLVAQALFPALVERASRHYGKPIKITLIGLVAALPPIVCGAMVSSLPNPVLKIAGITIVVIPAMLGLIGSAGFILRIGSGLPSPNDEQQPWRRVLRGGILLALTFLLPVVGWIILPIWVLVSGFGAFILSVRERPLASTQSPAPVNLDPGHLTPTSQVPS